MRNLINGFILASLKYEDRADINEHGIQLSPIQISEEYAKKWNEHQRDFVCISKDGELLNNTLYRVGGMGTHKIKGKKYFMLLKYIEAFYDKKITDITGTKDPKHLEGRWCIIDEYGKERVEFKPFESPSILDNSCIYTINSKYFNIETGELYCESYQKLVSKQYIFLENKYDPNEKKRGVLKINKSTGEFELIN